ncbi:MAG: winged helix-turn-helix transcriptional regulator [Promethearchaeota archaeon]
MANIPKFRPISFDKFQELIELIPRIQEAAFKGLERDLNVYEFSYSQLEVKVKLFKQMFEIIQRKWTIEICFTLLIYTEYSFNDLKRALKGISTRTLTDRLRLLEQRKIIIREVKNQSPLRVNYKLSNFGKEEVILFVPVLLNYLLPPKVKKENKFININEIQEKVRAEINIELMEQGKEASLIKVKEKF